MAAPKLPPTMPAILELLVVMPTGTSEGSELAEEAGDAAIGDDEGLVDVTSEEVVILGVGVGVRLDAVVDWALKQEVLETVTVNELDGNISTPAALPVKM